MIKQVSEPLCFSLSQKYEKLIRGRGSKGRRGKGEERGK